MQFPVLIAVQWLHIAMAMAWVGAAIALEVVVEPATTSVPLAQQQALGRRLSARSVPFFTVVGTGTLVLGVIRGTVLGPLQSLTAFGTGYGITWIIALVLTASLAALGALAIGPAAERLYASDELWQANPQGRPSSGRAAAVRHLRLLGRVQLAGFALVLACMVLMSFDL